MPTNSDGPEIPPAGFNKRLGPNRAPPRPKLDRLVRESIERVRSMSPEQLEEMIRTQSASYSRSAMPRSGDREPAYEPALILVDTPMDDPSRHLTDPRAEQARRQLRRALAGQPDIDSPEAALSHMESCIRSALRSLESSEV